MAENLDKLTYFREARGRAEVIRMLYVLADQKFEDITVRFADWPSLKSGTPLGQLPCLMTTEGELCQSNVIARHVARKLGLIGDNQWEATLHDLVVECVQELFPLYARSTGGIYSWMVFKIREEPENKDQLMSAAREKWITTLNYIQAHADKQKRKYIVGDELGLAEIWLYCAMEYCKIACPDIMALTPWIAELVRKIEEDPRIIKHLESRPEYEYGL